MSLLGGALLLGTSLASSAASGAGVAVTLEQKADGPLDDQERRFLRDAVIGALAEQQYDRAEQGEVDSIWSGEPELRNCFNDTCLERLGRLVASRLVVYYQIKLTRDGSAPAEPAAPAPQAGAAGKDRAAAANAGREPPPSVQAKPPGAWSLKVSVFDMEVGAVGATVTESCPSCTTEAAADKLIDTVKRAVLENVARPRGKLEVQTTPPNALVFVDGTELGNTPYKRLAFAGPHAVIIRSTGYLSQQHKVTVVEQQRYTLDAKLTPGTDPLPQAKDKPLYKKWWFWTAIGGAIVVAGAVTVGVVLGTRADTSAERMPLPNHIPF